MSDDVQGEGELSRPAKVLLYVMGTGEELRQKGLLTESGPRLSEQGMKRFHELRASGFEPTPEELTEAINFIQAGLHHG